MLDFKSLLLVSLFHSQRLFLLIHQELVGYVENTFLYALRILQDAHKFAFLKHYQFFGSDYTKNL